MGKTKIEWTDATWNPVTGCTPISEGCAHCYAARMAKRLAGRCGYPEAPHEFDVTLHPDRLDEPLRWRKPRRVFVCSMGDLFHEDVPFEYIRRVFWKMFEARNHTYQILTKRPQRMIEFFNWYRDFGGWADVYRDLAYLFPNVWLGVTAENQRRADERIEQLFQIPAAVRFVSVEPCLEQIDLLATVFLPQTWNRIHPDHDFCLAPTLPDIKLAGIDWVICGPETGPNARGHRDFESHARDLRDQCISAGVAFFLKKNVNGTRQLDGREWLQYPEVRHDHTH